jgi:hypothetical protein
MLRTFVTTTSALAMVAAALTATSALAHHSFVMFDNAKVLTLSGTVTEFDDSNPHARIALKVPRGGGRSTEWSIESESPLVLEKVGIDDSTLSKGERVTVRIHPLKAGGPSGSLIDLKTADGMVLTLGDHAYGERMEG